MKRVLAGCVLMFTVFAVVAGTWALLTASSTVVEAKPPCRCPLYCIEVTCDNGHTYCNQCLANCAGAKNCV